MKKFFARWKTILIFLILIGIAILACGILTINVSERVKDRTFVSTFQYVLQQSQTIETELNGLFDTIAAFGNIFFLFHAIDDT